MPNQLYHLRFCTHRRGTVFSNFWAARTLVRCLKNKDARGHTQTVAFVVMPDHVHWLCHLGRSITLAAAVGSLKSEVSRALRGFGELPQPLWQDGYFDRALREWEDPAGVARYIVLNPVRAGLVRTIREYPHWDCTWVR